MAMTNAVCVSAVSSCQQLSAALSQEGIKSVKDSLCTVNSATADAWSPQDKEAETRVHFTMVFLLSGDSAMEQKQIERETQIEITIISQFEAPDRPSRPRFWQDAALRKSMSM